MTRPARLWRLSTAARGVFAYDEDADNALNPAARADTRMSMTSQMNGNMFQRKAMYESPHAVMEIIRRRAGRLFI